MPNPMSKKVSYDYISEQIIRTVITKFIIYLVLLLCTRNVFKSIHTKYMYFSNIQTENMFLKTIPYQSNTHDYAISFKNILTEKHFWNYMNYNFIPMIQNPDALIEINPNLLGEGLIVGVPRIRQLRVKPSTKCLRKITVDNLDTGPCWPEYSAVMEDKRVYKSGNYKNDGRNIWTRFYTYSGGGFSINFHVNQSDNLDLIANLSNSFWIDQSTRLVVVELSVFYDNNEMFQIIKLILEIMPTGLVEPSAYIRCIPVKCFLTMDVFSKILGIVFFITTLYYTYQEICEIFEMGPISYLKHVYNYPDLLYLLTSYFVFAYNILHTIEIDNIYKAYERDHTDYINMDSLAWVWELYIICMGFLIFACWLKLIRFISFHRTVKMLAITVRQSFRNIFGFFFVYVIVLYAFAQLGTILFIDKLIDFDSNYSSLITLMRIIMLDIDYEQMRNALPYVAPFYFVSAIVIIYGISLNLFVAIYLNTYTNVKSKMIIQDREVFKMLKEGFKGYLCCWRRRERRQRNTFSIDLVTNDEILNIRHTEEPPPKIQPVLDLREKLARTTERSIQIEEIVERIVETIELISELQKFNNNY